MHSCPASPWPRASRSSRSWRSPSRGCARRCSRLREVVQRMRAERGPRRAVRAGPLPPRAAAGGRARARRVALHARRDAPVPGGLRGAARVPRPRSRGGGTGDDRGRALRRGAELASTAGPGDAHPALRPARLRAGEGRLPRADARCARGGLLPPTHPPRALQPGSARGHAGAAPARPVATGRVLRLPARRVALRGLLATRAGSSRASPRTSPEGPWCPGGPRQLRDFLHAPPGAGARGAQAGGPGRAALLRGRGRAARLAVLGAPRRRSSRSASTRRAHRSPRSCSRSTGRSSRPSTRRARRA